MKSNRSYKSLGRHRVRMGIAAALGTILLFIASAGSDADEPPGKESDPSPRVDTPFDSDTMPSAETLLNNNVLESPHWTAQISISATSADSSKQDSLSGTLFRHDQELAGKLQFNGDADREFKLLLNKQRAIAWTTNSDDKNNALLERLAKGIYLFGMLIDFPDQTKPRLEVISKYRLQNLGTTKNDGHRLYVIEAKPNKGDSASARMSSLNAERVLITVSVSDSLPRQISAVASNGSRLDLRFQSITTDAQADASKYATEPPKDAFVIDLSGKPVASDGLKNPVAYNAESIKRGKLLYIADCEVCHSVDGTGRDSDVTDNAADLTSTEFWLSDGSEAATFLAIRDGAGDEMPGYKDDYRDEKMIWDLVNYLRSLQK